MNLSKIAESLPEATIASDPKLLAGVEHIKLVILQAITSWDQGIVLARNKSLDLLMRFTSKKQISEAIKASNLQDTKQISLVGVTTSEDEACDRYNAFRSSLPKNASRDDSLLDLTEAKKATIVKLHQLKTDRMLVLKLQELSALLNLR